MNGLFYCDQQKSAEKTSTNTPVPVQNSKENNHHDRLKQEKFDLNFNEIVTKIDDGFRYVHNIRIYI